MQHHEGLYNGSMQADIDSVQAAREMRRKNLVIQIQETSEKVSMSQYSPQEIIQQFAENQFNNDEERATFLIKTASLWNFLQVDKETYIATQTKLPALGFYKMFVSPSADTAFLRFYSHETLLRISESLGIHYKHEVTRSEILFDVYQACDSRQRQQIVANYKIDADTLARDYTLREIERISIEMHVPKFINDAVEQDFEDNASQQKLAMCRAISIHWSILNRHDPTILLPVFIPPKETKVLHEERLYRAYHLRSKTGYLHKVLLQYLAGRHQSVCSKLVDFIGGNKLRRSIMVRYDRVDNRSVFNSVIVRDGFWNEIEQMCTAEDVRFVLLNITLKKQGKAVSHSNFVIIDRKLGVAEYYDPWGLNMYANKETGHKPILDFLDRHLRTIRNLNYKEMLPAVMMGGLQRVQNDQRGEADDWQCNTCQVWTYWYADVRLMYPDVPRYDLLCTLQSILHVEYKIAVKIFQGFRNFVVASVPNPSQQPDWPILKRQVNEQLQFVRNVPFFRVMQFQARHNETAILASTADIKNTNHATLIQKIEKFITDFQGTTNLGWDLLSLFKFFNTTLGEAELHTRVKLQTLFFKHRDMFRIDQQLNTQFQNDVHENHVRFGQFLRDHKRSNVEKFSMLHIYLENIVPTSGVMTLLDALVLEPNKQNESTLLRLLQIHESNRMFDRDTESSGLALDELLSQMELRIELVQNDGKIRLGNIQRCIKHCLKRNRNNPLLVVDRLLNIVKTVGTSAKTTEQLFESQIFMDMFENLFRNFSLEKFHTIIDTVIRLVRAFPQPNKLLESLEQIIDLLKNNKLMYTSKKPDPYVRNLAELFVSLKTPPEVDPDLTE